MMSLSVDKNRKIQKQNTGCWLPPRDCVTRARNHPGSPETMAGSLPITRALWGRFINRVCVIGVSHIHVRKQTNKKNGFPKTCEVQGKRSHRQRVVTSLCYLLEKNKAVI